MKSFLNEKVMPVIMTFINTRGMRALKDGILYAMPLLIIGSIFLLLANIPYEPLALWIEAVGLGDVFNQTYGATFNIMAMVSVTGIAYTYVKNEGYEPLAPGIIALACFILLQPAFAIAESGGIVEGIILKDWTSGKGMICAIIVGLIVGFVYSWFMKKDITIKMPQGVPEGVTNSFVALIPGAVIISGFALVYAGFHLGLGTTFVEWVYKAIQTPLQGMTDSLGGVILMSFMGPFLWFFGVHGSSLVSGIMQPMLLANSAENQAIVDKGLALTLENGGHIVTMQFMDQFLAVTGAGITLGLVVYILLFAKSAQLKELGKLGIGPSVFNINEPILFGIPIVLNPLLAIPFIGMPVLSGVIQYFAIHTGLCPMYTSIIVPWTTPPIISGFLVGGWRTALLQAIILVLSFMVYLPFIRKVDRMYKKNEDTAEMADVTGEVA